MLHEDLVAILKTQMESERLSQNQVARGLGRSASALSQWLQGTYKGDMDALDREVESFLQRQRERRMQKAVRLPFIPIGPSLRLLQVARSCHLDGEIGVVYGPAGMGKTTTCRQYAAENQDVILVEADLGYTARVLFMELNRRLGLPTDGTLHDLFERAMGKLRDSGRLIVIDEAEHLPYRALEMLRRLYDKAGVGVLLVGMPRLIANLRGKRGDYAQLYSRVGWAQDLGILQPEDAELMVKTVFPNSNGVWREFYDRSKSETTAPGNIRILAKLLVKAMRLTSPGESPKVEMVRGLANMLLV